MNMDEPKLVEELQKMQSEPLLPIEKKLIAWSLLLGLGLMVVLLAVSRLLFGE
jgi:hypothetical protein